ncbi:MAG: hypothetical protein AAGF12_02015 [Myxococcota bacterium]
MAKPARRCDPEFDESRCDSDSSDLLECRIVGFESFGGATEEVAYFERVRCVDRCRVVGDPNCR